MCREGDEETLLEQIQQKYPDRRTDAEKRQSRLKRLKTIRHMNLASSGEFGEPPPVVVEPSEAEQQREMKALVDALRPGPNNRTDEQLRVLLDWADGIAFFQDNVHNLHLLGECCKVLESVELAPGEKLFNEGDKGDCFYALIEGAVSIVEGPVEVVRLHPPATLGERALEEDAGTRTATVISVDGGVLARLDAETYHRSVMSEKAKRMLHMGVTPPPPSAHQFPPHFPPSVLSVQRLLQKSHDRVS